MLNKSFGYHFFILSMAIGYLPQFYKRDRFSIPIGPVDLYLIDICFLIMVLPFLFSFFNNKNVGRVDINHKQSSQAFLAIVVLFYLLIFVKYLIQSPIDTSTIRIWVDYSIGYLFVLFFPYLIGSIRDLRRLMFSGILFSVCIFVLHIYNFATRGFMIHILSGNFLTFLGTLYFLLSVDKEILRINPFLSYVVRILILMTYLMVGHRSGFIALLLGVIFLMFLKDKMIIIKQFAMALSFSLVVFFSLILFSPSLTSKLIEHASTTFDTQQVTYQGRYENIFRSINHAKEYPILGLPFGAKGLSGYRVKMKEEQHGIVQSSTVIGIVPHNLLLEWLLVFGYTGLFIGSSALLASFFLIKKFLGKYSNESPGYRIGIGILCAWIHNLFYAFANTTAASVYHVFCLYFPLVILISMDRIEKKDSFV